MKVEFALGIRARMGSDFGARSAPKAERTFWAAMPLKMITPEPDRTVCGNAQKKKLFGEKRRHAASANSHGGNVVQDRGSAGRKDSNESAEEEGTVEAYDESVIGMDAFEKFFAQFSKQDELG